MKLLQMACLTAALLAGASIPAQSQSLLGLVGGKDSGALVTLGSGDAGTSGVANVGLGGDNQLLAANVGTVANAAVGSGGSGGLKADVGLLNNTGRIGLGLGGDDGLDVDIGIGGGGSGDPSGPNGTRGGQNAARLFASTGDDANQAVCDGISARELEKLLLSTRIDGSWRRASNVAIKPVRVCTQLRPALAAALSQTGLGPSLRSAIARDPLLMASLDRSSYSASRVFAVRQSGREITLFVY